ncbi:hypothetical protein [Flammeovirga agarivorans]|uniref:Lipoprotein n=1 Tax=Flammeovirga agarivorans TaxID=2726742 RepID=A0A7X8SKJ8_9BACT|nr:hypothetical protein [Flammeovirga agarivorans]NLR91870.1 hypothetical protein [Flammeovirga agarivorans]
MKNLSTTIATLVIASTMFACSHDNEPTPIVPKNTHQVINHNKNQNNTNSEKDSTKNFVTTHHVASTTETKNTDQKNTNVAQQPTKETNDYPVPEQQKVVAPQKAATPDQVYGNKVPSLDHSKNSDYAQLATNNQKYTASVSALKGRQQAQEQQLVDNYGKKAVTNNQKAINQWLGHTKHDTQQETLDAKLRIYEQVNAYDNNGEKVIDILAMTDDNQVRYFKRQFEHGERTDYDATLVNVDYKGTITIESDGEEFTFHTSERVQ